MNKFFLNLGVQPLANNFLKKYSAKQPTYNLKLYFNTKTKMVSISKRIPSSVMFNSKYPYLRMVLSFFLLFDPYPLIKGAKMLVLFFFNYFDTCCIIILTTVLFDYLFLCFLGLGNGYTYLN